MALTWQPPVNIAPELDRLFQRAAGLGADEIRELADGYRRLSRFGPVRGRGERLVSLIGSGAVVEGSLVLASEWRAREVVGRGRERALLHRAREALDAAGRSPVASGPSPAGLRRGAAAARALANAALAIEAGGRLAEDDRVVLSWPWRDAIGRRRTIPDPGPAHARLPRRLLAGIAGVTAVPVLAALAVGSLTVAVVWLALGAIAAGSVGLVAMIMSRPALAPTAGRHAGGSGQPMGSTSTDPGPAGADAAVAGGEGRAPVKGERTPR